MNVPFGSLELLKDPLAVDDGGNHNRLVLQSIDNAIAIDNQLSDILVIEFRNLAPGPGKFRQRLNLCTTFFTSIPAYVGESAAMYSEMLSRS